MLVIKKLLNCLRLHLIQNLFCRQLMVVENTLDRLNKADLSNCHLYKYLLFLFDYEDMKNRLEYVQLPRLEILKKLTLFLAFSSMSSNLSWRVLLSVKLVSNSLFENQVEYQHLTHHQQQDQELDLLFHQLMLCYLRLSYQ